MNYPGAKPRGIPTSPLTLRGKEKFVYNLRFATLRAAIHPRGKAGGVLWQINNHMENQNIKPTGCCDIFDPEPWQEKETSWNGKLFVKDHIASFLHMPLNTGAVITKNLALIEKSGAEAPVQLMLTDEKSLWGADIYIDVAKNVAGAQMATLSGTFLTKVFEGPYQNAGKWAQEMETYVKNKGKQVKKMYFSYTTCPKCARVYGKNYVILFALV